MTIAFGLTRRCSLLLAAMFIAPVPIWCQRVVVIPDESACPQCAMRLEPVVMLGDAEGPGIIEANFAKVVRDSRGRYYVTTDYATKIKVFDDNGEFLRSIGRRGSGPGEFAGIGFVLVGSGDTLHVFDDTQRRWTVLSPNYDYVRSSRIGLSVYARGVLLDDGRAVIPSNVRTPERVGLPLHLINPDGSFARSFGSETGFYRADIPRINDRRIAVANSTSVWSVFRNQYTIEQWSLTGQKKKELRRKATWFPARLSPHRPGEKQGLLPPDPVPTDLQEDRQGRLWVLITVAGSRWREGVEPGGSHGVRLVDDDLYVDSKIELIDPVHGQLIASKTFPQPRLQFIDLGLVSAVVLDAADIPHVGIWRIVFSEP